MKQTLFIAFLLVVFSQLAYSSPTSIEKTWHDETALQSDIKIDFPVSSLPSSNKWSTITLKMNFRSANGDVDVVLNGKVIKHYGIDTDQWQQKTETINLDGVGDLVLSGHISKNTIKIKDSAWGEITATAEYKPSGGAILFAHGANAGKGVWDHFAALAAGLSYTVYRTDVPGCGSIADRAKMLAQYIKDQDLEDNSLVAVGHSMGGLDLRYIVGMANEEYTGEPFITAAKKIKRVVTIATPHGGSMLASFYKGCLPAANDVTNEAMACFNKRFTYEKFKNPATGNVIPFMAFYFKCPTCSGKNFNFILSGSSDCVIGTNGQTWKGAPGEAESRVGAHDPGLGCAAELSQNQVLYAILNLDH